MTSPDDLTDISELPSQHCRLAVEYDIGTWVPCPPAFPAGLDRPKWALTFAEAFSRRPGLRPSEREIQNLAATLSRIHEYTYGGNVACHVCFIHQPHPSLAPLPVFMATCRPLGGRDEALRRLTNADDQDVIQPPEVMEFTARELGRGLKVLRFGRQQGTGPLEDKIFGALNYAWRDETLQADLRVFASTGNIGRLSQAIPDIDELVNRTKIVPAPSA